METRNPELSLTDPPPRVRNAFSAQPTDMLKRLTLGGLILLTGIFGPAPAARGQEPVWRAREGLPVGSEAERYLRVLQVAGKAPLYPWTLRGFAPGEIRRILPTTEEHPWAPLMDFSLDEPQGFQGGWVAPEAGVLFNSSYPFGENDGALWAGKGMTGVVRGGGYLRLGRLHLRIAPEAFWAQNGAFDLAPNGLEGEGAFRDAVEPGRIDQPQRFGEGGYGRIDLGSSSLQLTLPGFVVGLSGAGQVWGPALQYPLLMGNNAGGFSNAFVQSSSPLNLWLFKAHGRYELGALTQSEFSSIQEGDTKRFMSSLSFTISPRGLDEVELGAARVVEMGWPEKGIGTREILLPFSVITHNFVTTENPSSENQLASAFFRITLPRAGIELFGEILKEDFARNLRHLIEEPDDFSGRTLGIRKVWAFSGNRVFAIRAEVLSAQARHSERMDRFRLPPGVPYPWPFYVHGGRVQSHTQNGQLLGSPAAYGGSAWTLGMDRYDGSGRTSMDLSRAHRTDWLAIHWGTVGPGIADVIYTLKLEAVRFRDGLQWTATVAPSLNLNRNVEEGNDVWNLNLGLAVKGMPW